MVPGHRPRIRDILHYASSDFPRFQAEGPPKVPHENRQVHDTLRLHTHVLCAVRAVFRVFPLKPLKEKYLFLLIQILYNSNSLVVVAWTHRQE